MTGRLSRLPASRGALPPAFGSPRDIWEEKKGKDPAPILLFANIPGVRAQPEGAEPPVPSVRGTPA
jgi:hypothetical protein